MLRIENQSLVPPGGWRYTQNIAGRDPVKITAHSYNQLLHKIELLRAGNGLDLTPGWEARMEDELCEQLNLGPGHCKHDAPPVTDPRRLTLRDMMVFLAVAKSWIATGRKWVSQEEADRRAKICAQCPNNVVVDGCSACSHLVSRIAEVIGGRTTPYDHLLRGCNVCGCENRTQAHIPIEALARGVNENMEFPSFCWKTETVELVNRERIEREEYDKKYGDAE